MSAAIEFELTVICQTCGKELYHGTATDEATFKEDCAKGITASELHDCQQTQALGIGH